MKDLTTIQVSRKTLKKVRSFCRKHNYVGRYWVESVLEKAVKKERGAANRNRSPE
jgi:hypothetical protein